MTSLIVYGCKLPFDETTRYSSLKDSFVIKTGNAYIEGIKSCTDSSIIFRNNELIHLLISTEEYENIQVFIDMHFCTILEVCHSLKSKNVSESHLLHRSLNRCARARTHSRAIGISRKFSGRLIVTCTAKSTIFYGAIARALSTSIFRSEIFSRASPWTTSAKCRLMLFLHCSLSATIPWILCNGSLRATRNQNTNSRILFGRIFSQDLTWPRSGKGHGLNCHLSELKVWLVRIVDN